MTIIIIIVGCWFLYKAGAVGLFLDRFKLEEYHTQVETPEPITKPINNAKKINVERMQAEKIAANILTYQGYKKDAFKLVKGLDSETLNNIINDFRNDLNL